MAFLAGSTPAPRTKMKPTLWITTPQIKDYHSYDVIGEHERTTMRHGADMEMKFTVEELLKILKKNYKEHKKIAKEAKKGYQKALIEELEIMLDAARDHQSFDKVVRSRPPGNNKRDYERTIQMLEMTTDTELTLSGDQFECYVMDRWHWQENFLSNASNYSISAGSKMSRM